MSIWLPSSSRRALMPLVIAGVACAASSAHPHGSTLHAFHGSSPLTHPAPEAATVERAIAVGSGEHVFESVPGWCELPEGKPIGNTHGTVVVDRRGHVYFNTDGVFTAPHGCCFDVDGNLYVMDWNAAGRVSKLRAVPAAAD